MKVTPRPRYPRLTDPVHILQEAVWAPRPGLTGAENVASTGRRSPDRSTLDESLYTDLSRPKRGMITVMIFMKSLSFMTLHFEALGSKFYG